MEQFENNQQEVILPGILGEFKEALLDEKKAIEKKGQSSTLLVNGRSIQSSGSDFWYLFNVDYLPSVPADTPCDLFIGSDKYSVTVVSFNENEIIVSSKQKLPDTIAQARLENGTTVLIERLISRLEKNSEKANPAGYRMIPNNGLGHHENCQMIFPQADVSDCFSYNEEQTTAISSAIRNNITYIWGPPGTGKTKVIGGIISNLFNQSRKVLVVSHTNTAVDGAIEKVVESGIKDANGNIPALRIGISQKQLPEEVTLKYHIEAMGKPLINRKEKLLQLKAEKERTIIDFQLKLQKIICLREQRVEELESEIKVLSSLRNKRDAAQNDYNRESERLKAYKEEYPEIKKLDKLKDRKTQITSEFADANKEKESIEKSIENQSKKISNAREEIAKHIISEECKSKLSGMMPERFLSDKIANISGEITSIEQNIAAWNVMKSKLIKTIAIKETGGVRAILSKRAIEDAEKDLPLVASQLEQLSSDLEANKLTRETYTKQLSERKSIQQQLDDVTTIKSKKYWENELFTAERKIEAEKRNRIANNEIINTLNVELQELNDKISSLQILFREQMKKVESVGKAKKRFEDATEKYQAQIDKFRGILVSECDRLAAFKSFHDEHKDSEKVYRIKKLYEEFRNETASYSESRLNIDIENLKKSISDITDEVNEINKKLEELETEAVKAAPIVGATLTKAYLSDLLQEIEFDTVICDEASMAPIPALWCAGYLAQKNIIIVGDFLQLPPIVISESPTAIKWLGRDIFEVSGMTAKAKKGEEHPSNFVMLKHQYRMEKQIADIANIYYNRYTKLISDDKNETRVKARDSFYRWYTPITDSEESVELIDTSSLYAWVTTVPQGKGHSRFNSFSATLSVEMAFQILDKEIKEITEGSVQCSQPKVLIVAPYKPHIERIKKLIAFGYQYRDIPDDANLIQAGTIHSFQGNEADVVIFDLVLDEPHWRANLFMTDPEVSEEMKKLFNVAVTRAKFKLFIVGNFNYLRKKARNNALSELLDYLINKKHFQITDSKEAIPDMVYARPNTSESDAPITKSFVRCQEDTFYEYFIRDLKTFSNRIIIYSPFITNNRLAFLLPYFADAVNSGKEIIVVTKAPEDRKQSERTTYSNLEKELLNIGITVIHKKGMHEKLVFVDDEVFWNGSLNVLSNSGETREIMFRFKDKDITAENEKYLGIPQLQTAVSQKDELQCPICGGEMLLLEGDNGVFWKCINGDYSRDMEQPYPRDGVLRCRKCGGEYEFSMKNEPRWVCMENSKHYQKMRASDLRLEKMVAKIPTKRERKAVDDYFKNLARK